jgi:hypothetical protein
MRDPVRQPTPAVQHETADCCYCQGGTRKVATVGELLHKDRCLFICSDQLLVFTSSLLGLPDFRHVIVTLVGKPGDQR